MSLFENAFTNIFWDGEVDNMSPDAEGDFYLTTDAQADHNYWHGKIVDALIAISADPTTEFQIITGGVISDGGSGTVNISECVAISVDDDGNKRLVHIPALTGVALPSGWNDGRQIWAIAKYDFKLGTLTRAHKTMATSYHYQGGDTYFGDSDGYASTSTDDLFVDSDPTGDAAIMGSFTMTSTTFADLSLSAGNRSTLYDILNRLNSYTVATGESLSADDVVEMINNGTVRKYRSSTVIKPSMASPVFESASTEYISACALTSDKILVAYRDVGNSNYGTAVILSVSGTTITAGSPVVFEEASTSYISAVALTSDKILVAYEDAGNSNYGTAIILSINGTTITYGSPVVFENATTEYISACALTSDKVLVAYRDVGNSNYGTAIILSINGTTITYGSPVVFESASTYRISACALTSDKVLVAYEDAGNSNYGTAVILSVSGTTITAGSPVVFENATTEYISACALTSDKVLVAYRDVGNSSYGTAIILSVSGTTITAGSPVVFEPATIVYTSAVALTSDKVLVAYEDAGNSYYGTAIILSVSGTTITAGAPVVFEPASTIYISAVALTDSKVLVAYQDAGNSHYGTAQIVELTNAINKIIGVAPAAASAGESANVALLSKSRRITTTQTLTPGTRYYVSPSGVLSSVPNTLMSPLVNRVFTPVNLMVGMALDEHTLQVDNITYGGEV